MWSWLVHPETEVPGFLGGCRTEVGARGLTGEEGRVPMPWHPAEEPETFRTVRALIHLRNDVRAVREGGMGCVVVHDDAFAYLREANERILVLVARGPWPGSVLPASLVADGAGPENLYGGAALAVTAGGLERPGDGGAQVWRLA